MKIRRILPLFSLLLASQLWASPKITFLITELRPGGVIKVTPLLPPSLTLNGDSNGLMKGEALNCEIVSVEETRKEDGSLVLVDRYLKCNDQRKLHVRTIIFEVSQ